MNLQKPEVTRSVNLFRMPRCDLYKVLTSTAVLLVCVGLVQHYRGWNNYPVRPRVEWVFWKNLSYREVAFPSALENHVLRNHRINMSIAKPWSSIPDVVMLGLDDRSALEPFRDPVKNASLEKYWSADSQLVPDAVPSVLHFLWCGKKWFEFPHYLVIMSSLRAIRPFKLIFHYEVLPEMDDNHYNLWMEDIKHDFPFLAFKKLKYSDRILCIDAAPEQKLHVLASLIDQDGGIFVGIHTWMIEFKPQMLQVDLDWALQNDTLEGYIVMRKGYYQGHSLENILDVAKKAGDEGYCTAIDDFYNTGKRDYCLTVTGNHYAKYYPHNIWDLENVFGRIARQIFYGTKDIRKPKPDFDKLVPNIAHMVLFGGGEMGLTFYLSVLSLLYVAKVDTVYIHGDKEPMGQNWDKLKPNRRVRFINRPRPTSVFQNKVPKHFIGLMSDILRVDLMAKYGGIYSDPNVIWVKPLSLEDRSYDAVASYDWVDWTSPFPNTVNLGVAYGKKNAPFWRIFLESMRNLRNSDPGFAGVRMPYKLLERYPHLLKIDPHLQVICYQLKCHPTWVDDYHKESNNHITNNTLSDWKNITHAIHWTFPEPPDFANMTHLIKSSGLFADMGKYVLRQAGLF